MTNENNYSIDPKIKNEINSQGFEENAAVIIDTDEERKHAKERIFNEGRAVDLETYLRQAPREILVTSDFLSKIKNETVLLNDFRNFEKGDYFIYENTFNNFLLCYIDKNNDLVKITIDPKKIDALKFYNGFQQMIEIKNELSKLGFGNIINNNNVSAQQTLARIEMLINYQESRLKESGKREARDNFDF